MDQTPLADQLSPQTKDRLAREHASLTDQVKDLAILAEKYPNDKWVCGQLGHFRNRLSELNQILGNAETRGKP